MSLLSPLWLENGTYSATQDRELIDAIFGAAGALSVIDLVVSQHAAGANMTVDVSAGRCIVNGTDVTNQGKYLCKSTAVTSAIVVPTAPATGHSRIDLIVAQVRDADADGGSNNDWIITLVEGTSATTGSQVAPAAPASSLVLAYIAVGPSVSSIVNANITNMSVFASLAAPGSQIAEMAYGPASPAPYTLTASYAVVDTTNLTVGPFVVPASGRIKVKASAWFVGVSSFAVSGGMAIFNHSGGALVGPREQMSQDGGSASQSARWHYNSGVIAGLTPGSSLQLDLAAWGETGSGATTTIIADDGSTSTNQAGPVVIEVFAA